MQADQINENEMKLEFDARSVNEGFARMAGGGVFGGF